MCGTLEMNEDPIINHPRLQGSNSQSLVFREPNAASLSDKVKSLSRLITWHTRLHNRVCPAGDFIHLWLHSFLSLPLILYGCPKLSNILYWGERQWNRACGKRETGGRVTMTIHPQPWITNQIASTERDLHRKTHRNYIPERYRVTHWVFVF